MLVAVLFFLSLLYLPSLFPFLLPLPSPFFLVDLITLFEALLTMQSVLFACGKRINSHTHQNETGTPAPAIICPCIGMGVQVTSNYRNSFRRFPVLNARRCGRGTRFLLPDRIISHGMDFHSNFKFFFFIYGGTNKLSYGNLINHKEEIYRVVYCYKFLYIKFTWNTS